MLLMLCLCSGQPVLGVGGDSNPVAGNLGCMQPRKGKKGRAQAEGKPRRNTPHLLEVA